jgi:hypothetical protein
MRRPVRMSGANITARLDNSTVQVTNLSLTGALLQMDVALPVDGLYQLLLVHRKLHAVITVKVIRSTPSTQSIGWHVAVTFVNLSMEAKRAIPLMLSVSSGGR